MVCFDADSKGTRLLVGAMASLSQRPQHWQTPTGPGRRCGLAGGSLAAPAPQALAAQCGGTPRWGPGPACNGAKTGGGTEPDTSDRNDWPKFRSTSEASTPKLCLGICRENLPGRGGYDMELQLVFRDASPPPPIGNVCQKEPVLWLRDKGTDCKGTGPSSRVTEHSNQLHTRTSCPPTATPRLPAQRPRR